MHEIGTVTTSLVFRELQRHRDTVEASLCAVRPYWIFPRRSKNGCWPSCGRPATAPCWLVQVLLVWAAGRTPTEIATVLFCSRSSVDRIVHAYHAQRLAALRDTAQ